MKNIRNRWGKNKGSREKKLKVLSGQGSQSTKKEDKRPPQPWHKRPEYQLSGMGLILIISVSILLLPKLLFVFPNLEIGDLVEKDIKAPTDLQIPDTVANQEARKKIENETPSVYDFDLQMITEIEQRIAQGFQRMRNPSPEEKTFQDFKPPTVGENGFDQVQRERKREFQKILKISLSENTLNTLKENRFSPLIEKQIQASYKFLMDRGLIQDKTLLKDDVRRGIILRVVGEGKESFLRNLDAISDIQEAEERLEKSTQNRSELDPSQGKAVLEITSKLLTPNITFNKSETVVRKQEAATHIKPLFYQVRKGETLLRAGERVTADHTPLLEEMNRYRQTATILQILSGLFLIVVVIVSIFFWDFKRHLSKISISKTKLPLLAILLVGTLIIAKLSHFFLITLADRFSFIDASTISFALPIAAGAMMVSLLFDIHIALLAAFTLSLFAGIMVPEENLFILYTFVGSLVAAYSVVQCSRRSGLIRAGLFVGIANGLLAFSINLYQGQLLTLNCLFEIVFGLGGGLLASLLVSAFLPLIESLFKVTTDIKLLELLDPNHPLLRNLFITARGTYYHSMMVSHLAESAAKAIDENPLLARVSCYYHDIGKMLKPEYYIENQLTGPNRHDHLSPNMSSLIIAAHVKEGIELAKSYKLPEVIIDIIPQHHGTRLMKFFYEKAKKDHDPELPSIKEEDFRYPGPKPQTKIAGIIMLADGVEASSRVLTDPSPARIETHVEKIVTNVFIDGQLDECNLTMSELRSIKECFTQVLTGAFHRRIEYPGAGPPYYGEPLHEGLDSKQTKDTHLKNKEYPKLDRPDASDVGVS